MTTYVGLLRAVNLGPHNKLPMATLRELVEAAGYEDVRTYIQSGNVVFASRQRSKPQIEATLEERLAEQGVDTPVMLRSAADLGRTIAANPFAGVPTSEVHVVFLKGRPAHRGRVDVSAHGPEAVHVVEDEAFVHYPNGVGRSKLTPRVLERVLGGPGTTRNWNTVTRLEEMAR